MYGIVEYLEVVEYLQYKVNEVDESKVNGPDQVYDDSEVDVLVGGLRDPRSTLLGVPFPTKFVVGGNGGWTPRWSGPGVTGRETFGVFSCDLL